jgi:glutaredoxin
MIRISGQSGVPVIVINGDVLIGFNPRVLEEKLH